MNPFRSIFISILFILLIVFIWYAGLKPLYINEDINMADFYAKTKKCDKALELMQSNVIYNSSTIDSYAKLKYISIIERCNARSVEAIELLKKVAEIRPYYTRTFIFLGNYTGNKNYFNEAEKLSPKREEMFVGKFKINFLDKNYQSAQENTLECIRANPESKYCWWLKSLSNFYLENVKEGIKDLETSVNKGFNYHPQKYLSQIYTACNMNANLECYEMLFNIFENLLIGKQPTEGFPYFKSNYLDLAEKTNKIKEATKFLSRPIFNQKNNL